MAEGLWPTRPGAGAAAGGVATLGAAVADVRPSGRPDRVAAAPIGSSARLARPARLARLVPSVVVLTTLAVGGAIAWAPTTRAGADTTGAGAGGGTVSVGAGSGSGTPGTGGTAGPGGGGSTGGAGASPWSCTYTYLALNNQGGFPPGGPMPGAWYSVTCVDPAAGLQVTQTVWVTGAPPTAAPTVDPHALALQAEDSIVLPRPTLHTDPGGTSVVGLATWLWVDPGVWHAASVTATAGPVSATAVAVPVDVRWRTGDGGEVVCDGPGTPYAWWLPSAAQATTCSYTYVRSSAGQPTLDGVPDDGTFVVSASIDWSVSWTSAGVAGGGQLPTLQTTGAALLRVAQVESVNVAPGVWSQPQASMSLVGW